MERSFAISLAVSLGLHLVPLCPGALTWNARALPETPPLELIYEALMPQHEELRQVRAARVQAGQDAAWSPAPLAMGDRLMQHIPEHSPLPTIFSATVLGSGNEHATVIDLTDVAKAAGGDPILLSYFSVLREQIERTAHQDAWGRGAREGGLVHVAFLLTSRGAVDAVRVVPERSSASAALQAAAIRIVTSAAPFPPFPPTQDDTSVLVIVPLDFQR
mgnify:CR=1 FL=1